MPGERDTPKNPTRAIALGRMPDHLHWLKQVRGGSLPRRIGTVKSRSSRLLGQQFGMQTSLWQPSYFDHAVRPRRQACRNEKPPGEAWRYRHRIAAQLRSCQPPPSTLYRVMRLACCASCACSWVCCAV
ncbi:transposase [Stenotrophomonas maltophilia]|uniref:transposase n=1 Tax=Stenotrophomonas maltophilia TaxID=40324 RepID=UPI0025EDDF9A|nr:transposase [uncultured Stenotrophomonas sp.]